MITTNLFFFCCLIFNKIYWCKACQPVGRSNFYNDKSRADIIKTFLHTFGPNLPVYDKITVPDLGPLIADFQAGKDNEDVYLNIVQIIKKYGYPVEVHEVVTEDKYVLKMHRIPKKDAPVIFLMHGVLCSADDWVTPGSKTSLAYGLADLGYDVWIGNNRGNKHSRKNLEISPDCIEFWSYSFDEIGRYDIAGMIDYILEHTGKSKIGYVGHSQGTTAFYILASLKPEYNDKIYIMVALSAVVYMTNVRSLFVQIVSAFYNEISPTIPILGICEIGTRDATLNEVTSAYCGSPETAEIFCQSVLYFVSGYNYPQINASMLPVIYNHFPSGASIGQFLHYAQLTRSRKFKRFDFGPEENMLKYNSTVEPEYPLENVTCPQAIFYSNNDWLTSATDTYKFLSRVPNVVEFYRVPCASYEHFDYLYAKDNDVLINNEIYSLLDKYVEK